MRSMTHQPHNQKMWFLLGVWGAKLGLLSYF